MARGGGRRQGGGVQQRVGAALADHEPNEHGNGAANVDENACGTGVACAASAHT